MSSNRLAPSLPPKMHRCPPLEITAEWARRSAGTSPSMLTTVHRFVPNISSVTCAFVCDREGVVCRVSCLSNCSKVRNERCKRTN